MSALGNPLPKYQQKKTDSDGIKFLKDNCHYTAILNKRICDFGPEAREILMNAIGQHMMELDKRKILQDKLQKQIDKVFG